VPPQTCRRLGSKWIVSSEEHGSALSTSRHSSDYLGYDIRERLTRFAGISCHGPSDYAVSSKSRRTYARLRRAIISGRTCSNRFCRDGRSDAPTDYRLNYNMVRAADLRGSLHGREHGEALADVEVAKEKSANSSRKEWTEIALQQKLRRH